MLVVHVPAVANVLADRMYRLHKRHTTHYLSVLPTMSPLSWTIDLWGFRRKFI